MKYNRTLINNNLIEYKLIIMQLKHDNHGVAGFFEDIPTLMVVTIGIAIFLISISRAFIIYNVSHESSQPKEECWEFLLVVRSYSGFLKESSSEGVFDAQKINVLTIDQMKNDLNPDFEFRIEIKDVSNYSQKYNQIFQTSELPENKDLEKGIQWEEAPISIHVLDNEIHTGKLIVTVWE